MLWKRILSALILIPLVGAALYLGGPWLLAGLLLFGWAAAWEGAQLGRRGGLAPDPSLLLLGITGLLTATYLWAERGLLAASLLWLLATGLRALRPLRWEGGMADWAYLLALGLYVGWPLALLLRIRTLETPSLPSFPGPSGLGWVLVLLVSTWANDTAAYLVGTRFGRRRLAPRLSPKKSWEGAWAGGIAGILAAAGLPWLWGTPWGPFRLLLWGISLALAAPLGDLFESFLKRQAGVKDSGTLIPGHGGALDRLDALLWVFLIGYLWLG